MVRMVNASFYENLEFLLCGSELELRAASLCPEKTRKRDREHLPR